MSDNVKKLVVVGDSWTYGSEIKNPDLPSSVNDWDHENDEYRIARIWPTFVGKNFNVPEVINLSYPAASNDRSVRHLVGWITQEYLAKNKDPSELFVIVGLTSPERKDFFYKDEKMDNWITMWPLWTHNYQREPLNKFARLYAEHFCNQEESTHRYLHQIFYLQNFFKQHNIKFLFFQSFYQPKHLHIKQWVDDPYSRHYQGQPDQMIWDMIDEKTFMRKNEEIHSFHNYITTKDTSIDKKDTILLMHPSPLGHQWWAEHVTEYIKENNLW
jgi:hypothetical protein